MGQWTYLTYYSKQNAQHIRMLKNYEKQLAKKSHRHNKSFYSHMQNKTKSKSNVGPLLKQDGVITR